MNNGKPDQNKERIAKHLAHAGVCSRRDAERMIDDGRVTVNGERLTTPAFLVGPDDRIQVDGKDIGIKTAPRLFLYHKPDNLVTSHSDELGRQTVFDIIRNDHPALPRLISVGRLDLNTEGLLLLTNDGGLSRYLELPATGIKRQYRVRVYGDLDARMLDDLKNGITVDNVHYGPIKANIERDQAHSRNSWIRMELAEGKNREIRKVLMHLGLRVNRLIRLTYGPFSLGELAIGAIQEISESALKKALPEYFKSKN